jgi:SAM-dependent methyltransferase
MRSLQRTLWDLMFGSRRWVRRCIQRFAATVHSSKILELGSGRQDLGRDSYSMRSLFDASNEFVQSDVVPGYGHAIVDATTMEFENEFDVILCTSVLEHVYDHRTALERIHRALKPGGRAVISVPFLFPYHDEPQDFWRFTEYGVRRLLEDFSAVDVKHRGHKRLPFTLFVTATK